MKKFLIILFPILFSQILVSQYVVKDGSELLNLQKLPQEKIYVHHTASIVFSGEYIYYKVYCQNAQNNRLSTISSIAYVSLVNESGNIIFEHKVKLENGMAIGDFFVNTSLPSGNYKLIAYTQWMKNSGLNQLYKGDVVVINPYLINQTALLDSSEIITVEESDAGADHNLQTVTSNSPKLLEIMTSTAGFSKREKVVLELRNYKGKLAYGNYSLLVQKKNNFDNVPYLTAEMYGAQYLKVDKALVKGIGDSIFLPEQRGELFYGQVLDRKTGLPTPNQSVTISIPGKQHLLKSALTGDNGYFYTYIRKDYKIPKAIVQVLDEGDFEINIKKQPPLDFSNISFSNFRLRKAYKDDIEKRSVYNQIENNFFTIKPDSILPKDVIDVFDGGIPEVFHLEDYTRFPTLQETLVEILNNVGYRSGGDYIRVAQEFEKVTVEYNDYHAIVLIDGVFIPNHSKIRDFDARLIKTIKVLQDELVLGSKQYQGLVAIETENGDYSKNYINENTSIVNLLLPRIQKKYFKQQYTENSLQERIPDYREILLWEPNISITENNLPIEFFTSDIAGDYEIILEGFTTYGKPISINKTISVE